MEDEIISIIVNHGFAVFVAVYVLTRMERAIKINTEMVRDLTMLIKDRRKKI